MLEYPLHAEYTKRISLKEYVFCFERFSELKAKENVALWWTSEQNWRSKSFS